VDRKNFKLGVVTLAVISAAQAMAVRQNKVQDQLGKNISETPSPLIGHVLWYDLQSS
jgi:hypothetical protein